jgi:dolichol-phosphate mannosyltransferase
VPTALVVIPTYNERANLAAIVGRVRAAVADIHVLVVDDNSPDGTGAIADGLATDPHVTVLHRPGKGGLGSAYLAGFATALDRGFDYVLEFDADGSHQPEELPKMLAALDAGADLAIGTRWMPGGTVENWPLRRRMLSRGATLFARVMLRSRLRDITSGYRGFRAATLVDADYGSLVSQGYCFQIELAWRVEKAGLTIAEVPITFIERVNGRSKMSVDIVVEAMRSVFVWGIADRFGRKTGSRAKTR